MTIEEAAAYFGIGMNKLWELTEDENCKFVLYIGSKRLIKRQMVEKYLEQASPSDKSVPIQSNLD